MVSVVVVEDQLILLDSLANALDAEADFEVLARLTSADEVDAACAKRHPDIVLMDVCTEAGASGIDAAKRLRDSFPDVKVVLMTAMPDLSFVAQAKEAKVASFIYKNIPTSELISVLRSSVEGYQTFPAEPRIPELGYNELTERELAVLRLVCAGKTRKEIAREFYLSENTIKANISSILAKTGFTSIAKLALYAISAGYVVVNDPSAP